MMRSMFSAVSGLRINQTKMDVIGNNIANVNTIGFKKSQVTFQDMLNETISGASAAQDERGGTNPVQVGLGTKLGSINVVHTGGSLQPTGRMLDLAIQGDGFFVLGEGEASSYTRVGDFDFDTNDNLVSMGTGLKVQGWLAQDGIINSTSPADMGAIQILPKDKIIAPLKTEAVTVSGNMMKTPTDSYVDKDSLDGYTDGDDEKTQYSYTVPVSFYDEMGVKHQMEVSFSKATVKRDADGKPELNDDKVQTDWEDPGENNWNLSITIDGEQTQIDSADYKQISFQTTDDVGKINTNFQKISVAYTPANLDEMDIEIDLSNLTQFASEESTVTGRKGDIEGKHAGRSMGELVKYAIDGSGILTGVYSNGEAQTLAQVGMAHFTNPSGLIKDGQNLYQESNNSGEANIGTSGTGKRGAVSSGTLEMSNVDLSQEFTDMIVTQRGFQANSRIISASDEMLQELVNLKR